MLLQNNFLLQSGKYRIIRVLGQGGFGITYLAENVMLGKQVAIKEFFPKDFCGCDNTSHLTLGTQNNAETVSKLKHRFLKEAQNISRLNHPGIVKIYDVFEENNTAYYVMDYIEGENLNEIVKRKGPLSEKKAVDYIVKIGEALEYIHSRNMTHFDVKPANIVLRKKDDQPILIDFGLSKQYDTHGDATSTLMQGISQGYSPIELYNYGSVSTFSPQTDIYSLGATLYYLLTGSVPPLATSVIEHGVSLPNTVSAKLSIAIKGVMVGIRGNRWSMKDFIEKLSSDTSNTPNWDPLSQSSNHSNEETDYLNTKSPNSSHESETQRGNWKSNKSIGKILMLIGLIIAIVGIGIYLYYHNEELMFNSISTNQYLPEPANPIK